MIERERERERERKRERERERERCRCAWLNQCTTKARHTNNPGRGGTPARGTHASSMRGRKLPTDYHENRIAAGEFPPIQASLQSDIATAGGMPPHVRRHVHMHRTIWILSRRPS